MKLNNQKRGLNNKNQLFQRTTQKNFNFESNIYNKNNNIIYFNFGVLLNIVSITFKVIQF